MGTMIQCFYHLTIWSEDMVKILESINAAMLEPICLYHVLGMIIGMGIGSVIFR